MPTLFSTKGKPMSAESYGILKFYEVNEQGQVISYFTTTNKAKYAMKCGVIVGTLHTSAST